MRLPLSHRTARPPKGVATVVFNATWLQLCCAERTIATPDQEPIPQQIHAALGPDWVYKADETEVWDDAEEAVIKDLDFETGQHQERLVLEGDCEDRAFEEARRNQAAGIPWGAMRIACCRVGGGVGHAVLAIECRDRTLISDPLIAVVLPFGHPALADHQWLIASDGPVWKEIDDVPVHLGRRERWVLDRLIAAARDGRVCPTNRMLSEEAGYSNPARDSMAKTILRLEAKGVIAVERFSKSRIVTILAEGISTAAPPAYISRRPHWRFRPEPLGGDRS